jgi:hypothetical protein
VELVVGGKVRARGTNWRIRAHDGAVVTLESLDGADAGAPGGPLTKPTAIGETPLTLEVLAEADAV